MPYGKAGNAVDLPKFSDIPYFNQEGLIIPTH
jgi:hypothetical protein